MVVSIPFSIGFVFSYRSAYRASLPLNHLVKDVYVSKVPTTIAEYGKGGVTYLYKVVTTNGKLNEKGYNLKEILHNYFWNILYIVASSLISRNIFIILRDFFYLVLGFIFVRLVVKYLRT